MAQIPPPAPIRSPLQLRDGIITSPAWLAWLNQYVVPAIQAGATGDEIQAAILGLALQRPADAAPVFPQSFTTPEAVADALAIYGATKSEAQRYPATLSDTSANLANYPAATFPGVLFYQSDTGALLYSDGAAWLEIGIRALADTYANWVSPDYDPTQYPIGTTFFITDRDVTYWVQDDGGNVWKYLTGTYQTTQSTISGMTGFDGAALGADDAGLALWISDYYHSLMWTGAKWVTVDGGGGGSLSLRPDVPVYVLTAGNASGMWKLLDGTGDDCTNPVGGGNPITYLKEDGTLGSITAWADIATAGNEAFPLAASGFDALRHAPAGQSTQANVANTTVQSGAGVSVASAGHTHDYVPTSYPVPYMGFKPYMRR